jgi:hypothetical protein
MAKKPKAQIKFLGAEHIRTETATPAFQAPDPRPSQASRPDDPSRSEVTSATEHHLNVECQSSWGGHRVARVCKGTRGQWVDGPKDKRGRYDSTLERVPAVELVIFKPGPNGEYGVTSAVPLSIALSPEDARRVAMALAQMASTIDGGPAVVPISSELTSVRHSTLD